MPGRSAATAPPLEKAGHVLPKIWPLFCTVSLCLPIRPQRTRGSPLCGTDRGMPIKYRPFRSVTTAGSEIGCFFRSPISDPGRISGVVFRVSSFRNGCYNRRNTYTRQKRSSNPTAAVCNLEPPIPYVSCFPTFDTKTRLPIPCDNTPATSAVRTNRNGLPQLSETDPPFRSLSRFTGCFPARTDLIFRKKS